jgi:hypothetical protein
MGVQMIRQATKAIRTFLTSTLDRVYGSSIELESETATELSTRAICPVDYSLIQRQTEARRQQQVRGNGLLDKPIRSKRLIVEDDGFARLPHVPESEL